MIFLPQMTQMTQMIIHGDFEKACRKDLGSARPNSNLGLLNPLAAFRRLLIAPGFSRRDSHFGDLLSALQRGFTCDKRAEAALEMCHCSKTLLLKQGAMRSALKGANLNARYYF